MEDSNSNNDEFNVNDLGSMNSDKIKEGDIKLLKKKNIIIAISIIIFIFIILLILIITLKQNKKDKNEIGEINCIFKINTINTKIPILGVEFKKESDFSIMIDDKKIEQYTKEYSFKESGDHKIKFYIYEDINMNYMFRNIKNLFSVEMKSDKKAKILSMKNTFESCELLENVTINGFDTNKVISIEKIFYNSGISNINLNINTKSIENMSFMFAGTNINYNDLLNINLNTDNVKIYLICFINVLH